MDFAPIDFDVVIIGAGISGINAAYRIQTHCPNRTFSIFEARDNLGGTWDLFQYPGIRSDSDLHTFGFPWRPWSSSNTIATGGAIVEYLRESAEAHGIDKKIQYHHKLLSASYISEKKVWSLVFDAAGNEMKYYANFVIFATGYYDYNEALPAIIPGLQQFEGQVIHPQFWPKDLDYSNKNVVIIGSGATAVTLLPSIAEKAAQVTMLQRSPGYIVSLPRSDAAAITLKKYLPQAWVSTLIRWKFLTLPLLFFYYCRMFPNSARRLLQKGAQAQLPPDISVHPHFDPQYNPWEQRLCICPNGDFYTALRKDNANVVTAHIQNITEKSIILEGTDERLHPDIIVTATGLKLQVAGGAKIFVDGKRINPAEKHLWKGAMIEDVPNAAVIIGYTNASWTLGADSTSQLFTRVLNYMERQHMTTFTPCLAPEVQMKDLPILNLNSTYIVKAKGELPNAGDRKQWRPRSTYFQDYWGATRGDINQDMQYT